jgi:ATP-dependent Lhr-like helicase
MNRTQLFDIAEKWFADQNWKPFSFQQQTWTAFLQGKNGLLNAPTGSGKTYALWFLIVLNLLNENSKSGNRKPASRRLDHAVALAFGRNQTGCRAHHHRS